MSSHPKPSDRFFSTPTSSDYLILLTVLLPLATYFFFEYGLNAEPVSTSDITLVISTSMLYLGMLYVGNNLINREEIGMTSAYFAIQSLLVIVIAWITEPGFIWIIFMPFVSHATIAKSPSQRWTVYLVVLTAMTAPYVRDNGWLSLSVAFLFAPAVFFVAAFTRSTLVAEEKQIEAERLTLRLEEANRKLAEYAVQAEELAITQERNRIAREIHDNLGHYLTIINVQLEAARTIMDKNPEKAKDGLEKAQSLTKDGLRSIRDSIVTLRENPVANRSIPDVIQQLIEESRVSGIKADFEIRDQPRTISSNTSLTIYRIIQEALTNVRKHANASLVQIILDYSDQEHVQISVADNGRGASQTESGYGLLGMQERVRALGGEMEIRTAEGEGFQLAISVPG